MISINPAISAIRALASHRIDILVNRRVGRLVRIGTQVHRPAGPHARFIHQYLRFLRTVGFDGEASPIGFDGQGREVLAFIDGDVATPPHPPWVQTAEVLASVAQMLGRMHAPASGFEDSGLSWSSDLVDPRGGRVVCHNDVCIENVVFRNGIAVGLIDFDYAAPGRAVYDIAQFANMCVPLRRATNRTVGLGRP